MSKTALQVSVEGVVKNAFRKFCHFFVKNFQFNVHEICCKFFDSNVYPPSADIYLIILYQDLSSYSSGV